MNQGQFRKAMHEKVRQAVSEETPDTTRFVPWFVAEKVTANDAALCRNTKPLIETAYQFFRHGIACRVEGRDIGEGLIQLATKWQRVKTLDQLSEKLNEYQTMETAKWTAKDNAFKVQAVEDKCETLRFIIEHLQDEGFILVQDVVNHVRSMFGDTPEGEKPRVFVLSTIHKAKGREWERVYCISPELIPSRYAKQAWQLEQENNLEYVMITRAKKELIYVR